jgi:glyoxylase-like metal-dependent hydrolase (beta-lactamase superfamily II)
MKRKNFIKMFGITFTMASSEFEAMGANKSGGTDSLSDERIICSTCGTQYNETTPSSQGCPICNDDRQYVPALGQAWTSLPLLRKNYTNTISKIYDNLFEIRTTPKFAIGQRAFLILTPGGNILWDCLALIDQATIDFIRSKGGLKAIVFSHPHYFTTMNVWAAEFDCPVIIHQYDEEWVFNRGNNITLWTGVEKQLWDGISIINIGGHFPGSSILRVPFFSPEGAIFCGDTFQIGTSKKHISVMYSYPNYIPVSLAEIKRIRKQVAQIKFDTLFGAFDNQQILLTGKELLQSSLKKYV